MGRLRIGEDWLLPDMGHSHLAGTLSDPVCQGPKAERKRGSPRGVTVGGEQTELAGCRVGSMLLSDILQHLVHKGPDPAPSHRLSGHPCWSPFQHTWLQDHCAPGTAGHRLIVGETRTLAHECWVWGTEGSRRVHCSWWIASKMLVDSGCCRLNSVCPKSIC